jgi:hypothetical protein
MASGEPLGDFSTPWIQNILGLAQGRGGAFAGKLSFANRRSSRRDKAERRETMMHPRLPSSRQVAVPGVGFPQNINIGPNVLDSRAFVDLFGDHCSAATGPPDRIVWLPSPRPWFAVHS